MADECKVMTGKSLQEMIGAGSFLARKLVDPAASYRVGVVPDSRTYEAKRSFLASNRLNGARSGVREGSHIFWKAEGEENLPPLADPAPPIEAQEETVKEGKRSKRASKKAGKAKKASKKNKK